jgi:hypothetical protein
LLLLGFLVFVAAQAPIGGQTTIGCTPLVQTTNADIADTLGVAGEMDGVYFGTGNTDAVGTPPFFAWSKRLISLPFGTLELALRVAARDGPTFSWANWAGPPVYSGSTPYQGGAANAPSMTRTKIDYSVRILPIVPGSTSLQDLINAGGRFEIGFDVDFGLGTSFSLHDPISFIARGSGGFQVDSWFLNLAENTRTLADAATFAFLLTTSAGVQNSFRPTFLTGITFPPATLVACSFGAPGVECLRDGRYDVYLKYSVGGVEQGRVQYTLNQGGTAFPPTENPSNANIPCSLGLE